MERKDRRDVGVGNDGSHSVGDVGHYPVDQLELVVFVIVVVVLVFVVLDDVRQRRGGIRHDAGGHPQHVGLVLGRSQRFGL
ncbi:MAG: hypothetical protein BWY94_02462 [Actinobacteria bacterium ADurb.BinA094]|nr:MAG: hypothetical protein BWY94_02462 [Actinobacteria bacterium ADurb.BinA094]